MVRLVVLKNENEYVTDFETMSQAYIFYLIEYANLKEWQHVLQYNLLNINDEDLIQALFRNCFHNACIITSKYL